MYIHTQLLPKLNHIHVPVPCNFDYFDDGYNMLSISHACWETAYDVLAVKEKKVYIHSRQKSHALCFSVVYDASLYAFCTIHPSFRTECFQY